MSTIQITNDLELMLCSAVRYALGRRTYIVSTTCNYIVSIVDTLSSNTLRLMENDIVNADSYGDACDAREWFALLQTIRLVLKGREENGRI